MHKLASFGQKPRSINQSNFYMNIPDSKLFSLIPDLKTPVVSYTYLHQFDSTKGTFQSRFFRIKLGRNKNRVSNFRGKISAKREIWIDSKNRFPHKTECIKLSKFSFHCLPCFEKHFHARSCEQQIFVSENRTIFFVKKIGLHYAWIFEAYFPPKLFSIRKKLHIYINFRSILQERSRPRINTPYRFSIKPSLKRAGQSNFDDGTTSPTTFFVQILALWNHVSMYLEYGGS